MDSIEMKNLSFGYEDGLILKDINLKIEKGDYLGIIGSNGTGKSTLIKLMLGLLQTKNGTINKSAKNIGYVPQVGLSVKGDFPATVMEVVMLNLYSSVGIFKRPKKKHYDMADKALGLVGMSEYKDRLISKLSGGQQQRVLIAKALVNNPELLILDEPIAGIDSENEKNIYQLLSQLNKDNGITIVMVTHSIQGVKNNMNKIYEIKDKKLHLIQAESNQ
ncbi:metal ABC transporter ATP-binding protein [Anaerocolumna sp. MB42-C2]|uniref:metal ABC transporter ATP-binding protein n=1 Tax=Anaerocolumna sp. MB42-C2 TaxID=3070997 RepID=UPI0027E16269|nr:ABC transporter ATP-binding protein [Anaerocolumna sp. MB42-C2]WMJ86494.1 ABC transporter ATP-binding protein [Anaerocolumna sp. MB42-C2]